MANKDWFKNSKYGMFIHWGAYSVAARGEWVLNRECMPYNEYIMNFVNNFKAEDYSPDEWVKLAIKSGMKYIILTTKHHDGFALWDTKTTDFNSVRMGPQKDLVRMFVDSAHKYGIKVGLYFSFADWHHEDYPGAYFRDWPTKWDDEDARSRFVLYYSKQLEELMNNYGDIDILWYDGCLPKPTDGDAVNKKVREWQPNILINNRNGDDYDFYCVEQSIQKPENERVWEACITLNDNWGYHAGDNHYKSSADLLNILLDVASNGGNLLLNMSPMANGKMPDSAVKIIQEVGKWLRLNGEGIYNSTGTVFSWNNGGKITIKNNFVYLYLTNVFEGDFCLAEIKNKVQKVYYHKNKKNIEFEQLFHSGLSRLILKNLVSSDFDKIATGVVIEVEGVPEPNIKLENYWIV